MTCRRLAVLVFVFALIFPLISASATADILLQDITLTVDNTGDTGDAAPGDGVCDTGTGVCTLRAAIQEANALSGADTIAFALPETSGPPVIRPLDGYTVTESLTLDASTQPAGTVILSGSAAGNTDCLVLAAPATVRGLTVVDSWFHAVRVTDAAPGSTIVGCSLGITTASDHWQNNGAGVYVDNAPDVLIGGPLPSDRNTISYNMSNGIVVEGALSVGTRIVNNYIGLNADGTVGPGNDGRGIRIVGASNTVIGNAGDGGNVISGNQNAGIELIDASQTTIQANYVGMDALGATLSRNGITSIYVNNSPDTTIGGAVAGQGNAVVGPEYSGAAITIYNSSEASIQGNYIGLGADGSTPLGTNGGIYVLGNSDNLTVGGDTDNSRNVFAACTQYGIRINDSAVDNAQIKRNWFGVDAGGTAAIPMHWSLYLLDVPGVDISNNVFANSDTHAVYMIGTTDAELFDNVFGLAPDENTPMPNAGCAVRIANAPGTMIGGTGTGRANIIRNSGDVGIGVASGSGVSMVGNILLGNAGLGIDLGLDGHDTNDYLDLDNGPNNRQNGPVIASTVYDAGNVLISGSLRAAASSTFDIDIYVTGGEGESNHLPGQAASYVARTTCATDALGEGTWSQSVTLPVYTDAHYWAATSTAADGSTSELSEPFAGMTPPAAFDDSYEVAPSPSWSSAPLSVLDNDIDEDGDALTAAVSTLPGHGTLDLALDGTFVYTPTSGYMGSDVFYYQVTDEHGKTDSARVDLTIQNSPPVALPDQDTTDEDVPVEIDVLANDTDVNPGDTLVPVITTGPLHGTAEVLPANTILYTPEKDYAETDVFYYKASDGEGLSSAVVVTVTINPLPDPPTAVDDVYNTLPYESIFISPGSVLDNDLEPDGDDLAAELLVGPLVGTLDLETDGTFVYTPPTGYKGLQVFTYRVSDVDGDDDAMVSITVTNSPPQGADLAAELAEDDTVVVDVMATASDYNDDSMMPVLATPAAHGVAEVLPDNTIRYTPEVDYFGSDVVGYRISDGDDVSIEYTISVTVTPVNDAPELADCPLQVCREGVSWAFQVICNDHGEGDVHYTAVGLPPGLVISGSTGLISGTPTVESAGDYAATISAMDGVYTDQIVMPMRVDPGTGAFACSIPLVMS